eukprot:Rhum_TRINITY_DN18642_c0_g1::Rhum_TRINITY_DN18642_c0_g1_i1::g.167845::m.167845/K10967/KTR1_3; alpha 1,2-mannosyltransferase
MDRPRRNMVHFQTRLEELSGKTSTHLRHTSPAAPPTGDIASTPELSPSVKAVRQQGPSLVRSLVGWLCALFVLTCVSFVVKPNEVYGSVERKMIQDGWGRCIAFRRTDTCSPYGFRDVDRDATCWAVIPHQISGYCECQGGVVVEKACTQKDHPARPFVCAQKCVEAAHVRAPPPVQAQAQAQADAASEARREALLKIHGDAAVDSEEGRRLRVALVLVAMQLPEQVPWVEHLLRRFELMANQRLQYPYYIFDRKDWPSHLTAPIRSAVSTNVHFPVLSGHHNWKVLTMKPQDVRKLTRQFGPSAIAEAQISRWWAGRIQHVPEMEHYDYFWRLNREMFLLCPILYNPVLKMQQLQKKVGSFSTAHHKRDSTIVSTYQEYVKKTGPARDPKWEQGLWSGEGGRCTLDHTNEIVDMRWMRSKKFGALFQHMDESNGFFSEKWTEGEFHQLALANLATHADTMLFPDVAFSSNSFAYGGAELTSLVCPRNITLPTRKPAVYCEKILGYTVGK